MVRDIKTFFSLWQKLFDIKSPVTDYEGTIQILGLVPVYFIFYSLYKTGLITHRVFYILEYGVVWPPFVFFLIRYLKTEGRSLIFLGILLVPPGYFYLMFLLPSILRRKTGKKDEDKVSKIFIFASFGLLLIGLAILFGMGRFI